MIKLKKKINFFPKLSYTKVLQGSIDLAKIIFPPGVYGRSIDVEARKDLWKSGLDYGHGTGHGIGYFLSVHESPPSVSYNSRSTYDEPLDIGMVLSDGTLKFIYSFFFSLITFFRTWLL